MGSHLESGVRDRGVEPNLADQERKGSDLFASRPVDAWWRVWAWVGGPEDYAASRVPHSGKAALWESSLATMRRVWAGGVSGQGGSMPALPEGRPALLFGGLVPAAYTRAATQGQGWVAPLLGLSMLHEGVAAVRQAWKEAGRAGQPRIATGRYFGLGDRADDNADEYRRRILPRRPR